MATTNARHMLLRFSDARLPEAILAALRNEVVLSGWLRGSGVLADVSLRTFGSAATSNTPRRIVGPVQAVVIDGSIGLAGGDVSCGLRVVLSRETETGIETIAGEVLEARAIAFEGHVMALDDAASARERDASGVWMLSGGSTKTATTNTEPKTVPAPTTPITAASPVAVPKPAAQTVTAPQATMPLRPAKPVALDEEEPQIYPDAGDVVEHFAFGRCEVVKSDGDRLHVRLGKDGRIKEIALEMLKITPLPPVEGVAGKHFTLDRKL